MKYHTELCFHCSDFESDIANNDQKLDDLRRKIEELDNEMKNHLENIERQSKFYRDCQA